MDALTVANEVAALLGKGPKLLNEHPAVQAVKQYLELAVEGENVSCETLASVRGDELSKSGRQAEADVCYGVAGRIRQRRPKRI